MALMITALNDLEIKLTNILNKYVQAPVTEKLWTLLGPEFGIDASKTAVIIRTLHDPKLEVQLSEANLPSAWNPWDICLVGQIQINGRDKKPVHMKETSITYICCIM